MNQDQQELTLEESVKQVMQTLPPPIRDYLSRGKYTPVAKELMAKYGLRIDQGGILERGMMLLLMGIEDPAEFSKALVEEAKLDQQAVNGIMQDINEQIFVPLREEMRKGSVPAPTASKPIVAPAPSAATPRVLIPAPPVRKPALRDVLASVMKAPTAPAAQIIPTPAIVSVPAVPLASPRAAPPENLPGVPRPPQTVPAAPAQESRTEPPKQSAPAAPAKPYSIDPYREPVDEK